jgi:hypothetical protein
MSQGEDMGVQDIKRRNAGMALVVHVVFMVTEKLSSLMWSVRF